MTPQMLDKAARSRLRTLSKLNADWVAEHLVMAGRTLDVDSERAYEHATAAVRRAGRVDVVREALALTAYATGRYAEALREVRTVRRLSGIDAHPAIEADCERGLGRPERALAVIAEAKGRELAVDEAVELTLVESGARADLGEHDAALLVIEKLLPRVREPEYRHRLLLVRADRLETLGRHDEAAADRATAEALAPEPEPESVVVVDLAGGDDTEPAATGQPRFAPDPTVEAGPPERQAEPEAAVEPAAEATPEPEAEGNAEPEARPEPEPEVEPESAPLPEPEVTAEPESASTPDEPEPDAGTEQLDLFADTDLEDRP